MSDQVPFVWENVGSNQIDHSIPGAQEIALQMATAVFDGTSAAGPFLPALQVIGPSGLTVGTFVDQSNPLAAGGTYEVTFGPFLRNAAAGGSGKILLGTSVNRNLTGQTIANLNATAVIFDTVLFDDLGWYDNVNKDRIKITLSGRYLVVFSLSWVYPASSGWPVQGGINHFPGAVPVIGTEFTSIAGSPNITSGSAVVTATAGDYFELVAFQASGGNQTTWFTGAEGPDEQPYPTLTVLRIGD